MTTIITDAKPLSENPLKSSEPLGAALAFLGMAGSMPLLHGSQGCTAFSLVLMVRHFKETIPIQTTAMSEVSTILGGADHLEEALINIRNRAKPRLIGVCTTALVETRGEDFAGDIASILKRRADELGDTRVVLASTPDFGGSLEEGWSKAVTATIRTLTRPHKVGHDRRRVVLLPGVHLSVADIELLRDSVEAFGLSPVILPDISGALDGTVPGRWIPTSYGGTAIEDIEELGGAVHAIAIGEHMRKAAEALTERTGVPYTLFETLTGLEASDRFVSLIARLAGVAVPARLRRRRSQLLDAMLDGHFHFGGRKIAIAAEPDLLYGMANFFTAMGSEVTVAVAATADNPVLVKVPASSVRVGDLGDFERLSGDADLLVTHAHGRQASMRLSIPLMRVGFPVFDRLGIQHRRTILYEGTRDLIFDAANIFLSEPHDATPDHLNPLLNREIDHASRSPSESRRH